MTALNALADELLAEAENALDVSRTCRAAFTTYRSHNAPAWGLCETDTLTVHLSALRHRQRVTDRTPCGLWPEAEFHVQFVRCVPADPQGPAPTALDASAADLLDDLYLLLGWLYANPIAGECASIGYGDAVPLGPSGGIAGYDLVVRIALGIGEDTDCA